MVSNKSIGANIRKHRRQLEMTQNELAKKLGVTRPSVVQYEKGNTNIPYFTILKIAKVLKITETELVYGSETMKSLKKDISNDLELLSEERSVYNTTQKELLSKVNTILQKVDLIYQELSSQKKGQQ